MSVFRRFIVNHNSGGTDVNKMNCHIFMITSPNQSYSTIPASETKSWLRRAGCEGDIIRDPDKVHIFISVMHISSPIPMFDNLLESSHRDDSNKWSNIGFGEKIT